MATTVDNSRVDEPSRHRTPFVLTGTAYIWVIVAASLDILLTGIVLAKGGQEVNPIANAVLTTHGFSGMVIFKYIAVFFVLLGCEFVARHNTRMGRQLAVVLIVIHFVPVFWSTSLLVNHS